jgi:NAD(P)-dependent dehydrogenase (short-subunit alcohol dehydrogenase family)
MRELKGRVAVITGAGNGIGRVMALAFAREGMDIALADFDQARLERVVAEVRALGVRAISVKVDVRELSAVERLLAETLRSLGACHLVINNAGVFHGAMLLDTPTDEWQRIMDTNLWGVIHGCRVFGTHFAGQGLGHIVNTASAAGLLATPGMSAYTATKFAVVGLSQQLRWELAGQGIGVTWICPGTVGGTGIGQAAGGLEHVDLDKLLHRYPTPEKLAPKVVDAVRHNRPLVLYGAQSYLASVLRLLPAQVMDPVGKIFARQARGLLRSGSAARK